MGERLKKDQRNMKKNIYIYKIHIYIYYIQSVVDKQKHENNKSRDRKENYKQI